MAAPTARPSGTAPRAVQSPKVPKVEGDEAASFVGPLMPALVLLLIGEQPLHG